MTTEEVLQFRAATREMVVTVQNLVKAPPSYDGQGARPCLRPGSLALCAPTTNGMPQAVSPTFERSQMVFSA